MTFKILKKELSPKNSIPGKAVLQKQRRDKEIIGIKFLFFSFLKNFPIAFIFYFYFFTYFYQLEANFFTILQWVLSYIDMNQPWIYMHSPSQFPIPIPPPTSLSTRSLWVFPVYQARALVSRIQPGLVICFTIGNIHVLMLFPRNIPPLPSPTESKSLFCTSVSLFLF